MGISQTSAMRNLRANKSHPYKLQMLQRLTEDSPVGRVKFSIIKKIQLVKDEKDRFIRDANTSGRPKTATDEGTSTQMLEAMSRSPSKEARRVSAQMRISESNVERILRTNK
ncbi:hypothetical protein AVEN_226970-1 [Araneus ventricosus]|uniref:Uncharacterized protein n=1 Tax=Araneus ventricosus TaxID=182803 RepID=A0A4Y2IU06_ARAVE|nr:hypothetical protein AVEN_226970-1 [Araneus ventricosus]